MLVLLCVLACAVAPYPPTGTGLEAAGSFLCQPAYALDEELRGPSRVYEPQPGDILLFADYSKMWDTLFAMARTGPPHHAGLVIRRPDGTLATVEAGYHDTLWCRTADLMPRLYEYETTHKGKVYVRQRRVPITEAESALLTEFARAEEGKPYAFWRNAAQLTHFRSRGRLQTGVLGGPHGDRRSYWCSEFTLECLVHGGLLDPATTRPCATYPRDIFFDASPVPFVNEHLNLSASWYPPARWTNVPVR